MPDVHGTGERKVYPKAVHCSQISYKYFVEKMARRGFTKGLIDGVLGELVKEMEMYLGNGHSVKIDGLGTFNIALGMKNQEKAEVVKEKGERYDTKNVYIKTVQFLPDADWMRKLRKTIELNKVGAVKTLKPERNTLEERHQIALKYLEKNSYMRVMHYMMLTGANHNAACKELRAFSQDPTSGIMRAGRGNQLIYLKRPLADEGEASQ